MADTQTLDPKVQKWVGDYSTLDDNQRREGLEQIVQNPNPETAEQEYTDPWQVRTLADAYQPRPPSEFLAGGLFELPSLNIVYGAPGAFKSMLMADLAVCVAAGLPWLEGAPWLKGVTSLPTKQVPVMWLDFDNGRRRTDDRFEALAKAKNLPADIPLYYYSMPAPWLNSSAYEDISALSLRILKYGVKFVILDNLGTVSGDADENSKDMGKVMSHYRQLAENTGAANCLIHHPRKGNGFNTRAGESLRGHSSIEAALDLALLVERETSADSVTVKPTKVRGGDIAPFRAVFTYEHKENSNDLAQARFWGLGTDDTNSSFAIRRAIKEVLSDGESINKTKLVNGARDILDGTDKPGINRVRDEIDRMVSTGDIVETSGKATGKLYTSGVNNG